MPDLVMASIISFIGVIISVLASVVITRFQNQNELNKLKKELEQQYAKSLFDKRIQVYPELYNLLSQYSKTVLYRQQTAKSLVEFRDTLDKWNSQNAIFFTDATKRVSYKFRFYLKALLSQDGNLTIHEDDWKAIVEILQHFESCLRAELGITSTPSAGELTNIDVIYKYIDERRQTKQTEDRIMTSVEGVGGEIK